MSSRVEASTYPALNHIFRKFLSHRARREFISRSRMMRLLCADCMRPSNEANVPRIWIKTSALSRHVNSMFRFLSLRRVPPTILRRSVWFADFWHPCAIESLQNRFDCLYARSL
jgi:hypothetical protein